MVGTVSCLPLNDRRALSTRHPVGNAWLLQGDVPPGALLVVDGVAIPRSLEGPAIVLADSVEVAAVLAGWTEAGKSAVLDQLQGLSPPAFPITGNDLIAAGLEPGPALGAELDRLERAWIESSFALERPQLLGMARR